MDVLTWPEASPLDFCDETFALVLVMPGRGISKIGLGPERCFIHGGRKSSPIGAGGKIGLEPGLDTFR